MHSVYFGLFVAIFLGVIVVEGSYENDMNYYPEAFRRRNFNNDMMNNFELRNAFNNDAGDEQIDVLYTIEKRDNNGYWAQIGTNQAITDAECPNLKILATKTLAECAKACQDFPGCTGFNIKQDNTDCILRKCSTYPANIVRFGNYNVWALCTDGNWLSLGNNVAISDAECPNLKNMVTTNFDQCAAACLATTGCTAFNIRNDNSGCVLRKCSKLPPSTVSYAGNNAWAICTKSKYTGKRQF